MKSDHKALVLLGTCISPAMAAQFSDSNNITNIMASMSLFQSGEPYVELFYKQQASFETNSELLKGKDVLIIQSTGVPVAENSLHLLMMVNTLKSYGAGSITVAMPFAPFMRQDRKFDKRFVSLGATFFAQQLKNAGADKIITITPHSQDSIAAYQNAFGANFTVLNTTDLFSNDIKKDFAEKLDTLMIGAPDGAEKPNDEGQRRARELARAVFGPDMSEADLEKHIFKISKVHTDTNVTKITGFDGDVTDKNCIVIDDMIDGGTTTVNAASRLKSMGAAHVSAYATHGIFSGSALEKLLTTKPDGIHFAIDKLKITDTLPDVADKRAAFDTAHKKSSGRMEILTVAGLIYDAALSIAPSAPASALAKNFPKPGQP